jgi:hypothetical protein
MGKHVMILGAGASYTSGYPLAEGIRRIVSSEYAFRNYLLQKIPGNNPPVLKVLMDWFSSLSKPIRLFREGGFGTIDEFSFLAGTAHPKEVREMKQLVGAILALHNPEGSFGLSSEEVLSGFESSDYYPFIQRLFREKDEIRNDLAVLTYNYDP